MINSKSTVSAVSQVGHDNIQDEAHFNDGDMDMDNVVVVEEQEDCMGADEVEEDGL